MSSSKSRDGDYSEVAPANYKTRLVIRKETNTRLDVLCPEHLKFEISVNVYKLRNNDNEEIHEIDNRSSWPIYYKISQK